MAGLVALGESRWHLLLRPKWLAWHLFAVLATAGMLYLGDWQLRRAEAGNELSWAYTFEWPIFAVCGLAFWIKSLRDELKPTADCPADADQPEDDQPRADATGAGPTSADGAAADAAYLARLTAEVRGHGRWHGIR